jgi:hypothetical protein
MKGLVTAYNVMLEELIKDPDTTYEKSVKVLETEQRFFDLRHDEIVRKQLFQEHLYHLGQVDSFLFFLKFL